MNLSEFEERFDMLWKTRYAIYDPETSHWTVRREDEEARQQSREMLMEYAREIQRVGISRRGKNKPQRLFDELGIDPADLDLNSIGDTVNQIREYPSAEVTKGRIMYIERKAGKLTGEARIGRVTCSKSGRTLYYGSLSFRSLWGKGSKSNYYCVETGEDYWISGCKRNGQDRLYGERVPVIIDEDVRIEYWTRIRLHPERKEEVVV
jgi:hypothetical protein